jgi:hypothetical protein
VPYWRVAVSDLRLVSCVVGAVLLGGIFAITAFVAGLGLLSIFGAYLVGGAFCVFLVSVYARA